MTQRLLLVEQSATMRYVLEKHAESLGFAVGAYASYSEAANSLTYQFQKYGAEFDAVIFGWPTTTQEDANRFAQQLEGTAHKDLPVVVMSTDMRAETRAWVAGRDNTAMLAWKEYQALEARLKQLIDTAPAQVEEGLATRASDNADVHLLVVDDSATIRYSLRDLFHLQGYRVTLATTHDEAMQYASKTAFDIAVLDYYLAETTGDSLCRELLVSPATGDIVCAVLTGTYSDHIIRRSLRAGAVECMFKNESSELLLSRIDAISRFVRQRRQLQSEQKLLEQILECIAGAVILINDEKRVVYANTLAVEELKAGDKSQLVGQRSHDVLEPDGPRAQGSEVYAATWQLPGAQAIEVDYQHTRIDASGYSLLRFTRRTVPIVATDLSVLDSETDPDTSVDKLILELSLPVACKPFLMQCERYLTVARQENLGASRNPPSPGLRVSLLLLDVFAVEVDGSLQSLASYEPMRQRVSEQLQLLLSREHHVMALGENRFGMLLRSVEDTQAYGLTRKVMQHCLEKIRDPGAPGASLQIACRASLLSLTRNANQPLSVLVQHAYKGMDLINARQPDQALLLDVRRLLNAYPTSKGS